MATVGSLCEICYVGHFEVDQGLLICDQCGTQSQAYQETEHEIEGAHALGKGVRRVREPKAPKDKSWDQKQPRDASKLVRVFCACLQRQLQRQLAHLQRAQGVSQQVEQIAQEIWLAKLDACGCFQESFLKSMAEAQPGARPTAEQESAQDVSLAYSQQALWKVLPPVTTLLICFLACWVLREAILPSQFVAWAVSGHLPFLDLAAELAHVDDHEGMDLRLLHPTGLPSPSRFVQEAAKLADKIQLALPPANAAGYISCFCSQLTLPKALVPAACAMADVHLLGSPALHLSLLQSTARADDCMRPLMLLMAALITAICLCWGLDGGVAVPGMGPAPDWGAWARQQLAHIRRSCVWPLSPDEAVRLTDAELADYLKHLKGGVFQGNNPPEQLESTHELLATKADAWRASAGSAAVPDAHTQAAAGALRAIASRLPGTHQQVPGSADAARPYQLHRQAHSALPLDVHPDYLSVLTACAALLWVKPTLLHSHVCQLEQQMLTAEAGLRKQTPNDN